jgi:hypothetical protein
VLANELAVVSAAVLAAVLVAASARVSLLCICGRKWAEYAACSPTSPSGSHTYSQRLLHPYSRSHRHFSRSRASRCRRGAG